MVEGIVIGFSDMLSIAQTIGIVGTMALTLIFSRKQLQSLSIHDQTRVFNDLDEKVADFLPRKARNNMRRLIKRVNKRRDGIDLVSIPYKDNDTGLFEH